MSPFFKSFFLATGVLWCLCAIAILTFELNFQKTEILLTLLLPMAYAIVRYFETKNSADNKQDRDAEEL